MPFLPQSFEEKPYNMCIDCKYIGKKCDGPNFLAMETDRWCEWCKLRKEYLGWTNAHVAELAEISKISVDRVMSGNIKDIRISTMQAITKVLVNGSWGQYPCAMMELSEPETIYVDNPETAAECKRLQAALDKQTEEHKADMIAVRSDDQKKIDYLMKQIDFKEKQMLAKDKLLDERADYMRRKDRYIAFLAIGLVLALLVIIAALVVDKMNADVGFFWIKDTLSAVFGSETGNTLQKQIAGWRL